MPVARRIVTVDKNPYLARLLLEANVRYIVEQRSTLQSTYERTLCSDRFDRIDDLLRRGFSLRQFFELCQIDYLAPADAASTGIASGSVDYHTSRVVLEHIPPKALKHIVAEALRIVRPGGLLLHRIDYSDHFAYSDRRGTLEFGG